MEPDPKRPYKAIAAFVFTFAAALLASIEGRPSLEGMKVIDWLIVVLGALVVAGATFMVKNPPTPGA